MKLSLLALEDRLAPAVIDGFTESVLATGLTRPSALSVAGDGRIFVAEQAGTLRVVNPESPGVSPATALTLAVDPVGERGLVGVTLAPDFAATGHVYLFYTPAQVAGSAPFNRVSRFTLVGDRIDPASEVVIVNLDPLTEFTNHNGGALRFGADGKLYVGVGDNSRPDLAQSPTSRHGKVLRLNPDGSVPADNPTTVAGIGPTAGANRAIVAAGLRNPYTMDVDRVTGEIFVNDVGQGGFEEVNRLTPGANFGWPATEGNFDPRAFPAFTNPVYAYAHGSDSLFQGRAITGGAFYRPAVNSFPAEFVGDYFFVDFVNRWVNVRARDTGAVTNFARDLATPFVAGAAVRPTGELLVLGFGPSPGTGSVIQFAADPVTVAPVPPPIVLPVPPAPPVPDVPPLGTLVPPAGTRVMPAVPEGVTLIAAGAGPGGGPVVVLIDPVTGTEVGRFFAFEESFTGGVNVVAADINSDGFTDVLVGAGPGGGPRVRVFDGRTRAVVRDFFAFEETFTGGVTLAVGNFTFTSARDIVVGADAGGGPRVRVFDGAGSGTESVADFFAFEETFTGGVRLAVREPAPGAVPTLVVAAGPGGGPRVAEFLILAPDVRRLRPDFFAFEPGLRGGVAVASGDLTPVERGEIVVAAGPGGGPRVRVLSDSGDRDFFVGDPEDRSGLTVAVRGDRLAVGRGGTGRVTLGRVDATRFVPERELDLFPGFLGGVRVG